MKLNRENWSAYTEPVRSSFDLIDHIINANIYVVDLLVLLLETIYHKNNKITSIACSFLLNSRIHTNTQRHTFPHIIFVINNYTLHKLNLIDMYVYAFCTEATKISFSFSTLFIWNRKFRQIIYAKVLLSNLFLFSFFRFSLFISHIVGVSFLIECLPYWMFSSPNDIHMRTHTHTHIQMISHRKFIYILNRIKRTFPHSNKTVYN